MDAGTLGSHAHGPVRGARARTRRRARVKHLSDAVDEAVVVDAPLAPVVPELVVQVALGGVLRRAPRRERRRRPQQQEQQQLEEERGGEAAEPVAHGGTGCPRRHRRGPCAHLWRSGALLRPAPERSSDALASARVSPEGHRPAAPLSRPPGGGRASSTETDSGGTPGYYLCTPFICLSVRNLDYWFSLFIFTQVDRERLKSDSIEEIIVCMLLLIIAYKPYTSDKQRMTVLMEIRTAVFKKKKILNMDDAQIMIIFGMRHELVLGHFLW